MAVANNKRRKLEHVSSDEDDDNASFASFADASDGEELAITAHGGNDEDQDEIESIDEGGDVTNGDISEDSTEEEDGAEDSIDEDAPPLNPSSGVAKAKAAPVLARPIARPAAKDAPASGNSAYISGSFKSNIFKLQVDELLEQIRPRHGKRETAVEEALHTLKKTIEQVQSRPPQSIEQAEKDLIKEKTAVPFPNPRPPKDAKYKLEYARPTSINVVGSYALKTANRAREVLGVDMVVQMPSILFQEKDYLNHRYFYKRAFYLACLASGLKRLHGKDYNIQFQELHGNPLCPGLAITPLSKVASTANTKPTILWQVNILLSVGPDLFLPGKLGLHRNCVRLSNTPDHADSPVEQIPTPFYNSTLRSTMVVSPYLKLIHKAATSCPAFRDACLLGSSWLRQRGLGSTVSAGGFGSFEWSALMALLLQGGGTHGRAILSDGYSSYQLLKATLQLLALKDLNKQPLTIGIQESMKRLGDGSPVVWDAERSHNLLFKMTPWSYRSLQSAAKTTLVMLGDQQLEGFEVTFILRTDSKLMQFDQILVLGPTALSKAESALDFEPQKTLHRLYDTLQRGLGDRVSLINIQTSASTWWSIGTARPIQKNNENIIVGLVVNPDNVNRSIDHGPAAEDKAEAAAFRRFWGEKAELRRFKDGSILESLIWATGEKTLSVLEQVVRFVLQRHFGGDVESSTKFLGNGLSGIVRNATSMLPYHTLMEAYKKLETDIRGVEGMPLTIRQLTPADPQLRFASLEAPMTNHSTQPSPPATVTIQFEGSGRWPDDLVAIQRTKIAFLLKFSELLQGSVAGVTTRIGLENQEMEILNQAFLDIVYDSGAAFRLRIHHEREQSLLERQLKDKSLDPKAKEVSALALAKYKRDSVKSPSHTQAIAQLCRRHASLSGAMRLTKKWFASHLLSNHVPEEIIELLVARTFVQPWPWQTPSSVQTGFLRTLLWISRWDWRTDPLIVDLSGSGELKQAEMQAICTRFDAWRKLDPALNRVVLFAASNVDPDGTTWTDGRPSKVVASRLTGLARAAMAANDTQKLDLDLASLFVSPLSDYDFVIQLDRGLAGRKKKSSAFKNLELDAVADVSLTGYEPVEALLSELETLYSSAILFFCGGAERGVIAGLWNPQTAPRSWKVNLAYSTAPTKADKGEKIEAQINKSAILAEIARLGGDMIKKIEVSK